MSKKDKNPLDDIDAGEKNQLKKEEKKKFNWRLTVVGIILLVVIIVFVSVSLALKKTYLINEVFYTIIINNILAVPSILIGIIVFLGYLLQKKPWYEALSGGLKGIIGYLILQMGSSFLVGVSKPLMTCFGTLIGSKVVLLDPYTGWVEVNKALGDAVSIVSYCVLVGLAFNILLVALKKITNVRSINVTGHIMFQQTATLAAVMYFFVFKNVTNESVKQTAVILVTGVLIGAYWGVFSNLAFAPTQIVTKNAGFSIGHQQMFGVWIASRLGTFFRRNGKNVKDVENLSLKKGFSIFHDNIFSSSVLMIIFFGILFMTMRFTNINVWNTMISQIGDLNLFKDKSWVIQMIGMIFTVVASIQILMTGARMFVSELQRSFIGISNKLIPGAVVAIDIAGSFSYGQKAVTYGFLAGALGNFIGMGFVILLGQALHLSIFSVVIMVGFIPMFFDNGALGLYANSTGGWKACITIPFVFGIITVLGAVFVVKTAGSTNQLFTYGFNGMFDWTTLWSLTIGFLSLIPTDVEPYMTVIILLLFLCVAQLTTTEVGVETKIKQIMFKRVRAKIALKKAELSKKENIDTNKRG